MQTKFLLNVMKKHIKECVEIRNKMKRRKRMRSELRLFELMIINNNSNFFQLKMTVAAFSKLSLIRWWLIVCRMVNCNRCVFRVTGCNYLNTFKCGVVWIKLYFHKQNQIATQKTWKTWFKTKLKVFWSVLRFFLQFSMNRK